MTRTTAAIAALLLLAPIISRREIAAQARNVDAVMAAMQSDLTKLVAAEEAHYKEYEEYAAFFGDRMGPAVAVFAPSPGNKVELTSVVRDGGWGGIITTTLLPQGSVVCGVFVGPAARSPNPAVTIPGIPACWGSGVRSAAGSGGAPVTGAAAADILMSMQRDLRDLVTAQEAYWAEFNHYAPAVGPVSKKGEARFVPTGNNHLVISGADAQGWTGVITNPALTSGKTTCGVFIGAGQRSPNPAVTQEGAPVCW